MRFDVGMPMHSIPARFPGACPTTALDYQLQQARTFGEVREAQRLRYQVFNVELGEGLPESHADGHDADPFDAVCDHLLVRHGPIGAVVGTYRIQTGHNAAACLGYYSGQEFDLQPFEPLRDSLIELGRACIHPDHRSLTVLGLLWRGIARYARVRRARFLMGCSSLPSQNPHDGAAAYAQVRHRHLSPPHLRTVPLAGWECPLHENDDRPVQLPRLLRAYLGLGAVICGPPAIDRQFKTIDFLTLLDLQALPLLGIELNVMGQPPDAGLLVCNHLGYLDILVLAALCPAVFVAKSEVADWPVMGRLARMAGTLFVDRQRRLRTRHTADEVDGALRSGNLVVLFPEGTSSDGAAVLPFHSALLEPARLPGVSVHAAHLSYEVTDGSVADEVCYWRDMTLLPHLLNLLGKKRILARVRFGRWTGPATDRKALASGLRELVCGLQRD